MFNDANFHYLVKATYQPRVLGFGLAVVVSLSHLSSASWNPSVYSGWHLIAYALLFVYPHGVYWISGRYFNYAAGARIAMLADGLLVGLLLVANHFYLFSIVTFVSLLIMSTSVIAGPGLSGLNLCLVALVVCLGWLTGVPIDRGQHLLTDLTCAFSILAYHAYVAYLCFGVTRQLGVAKQMIREDQQALKGVTSHLRRYISPQLYAAICATNTNQRTSRKRLTVFFSDIEGFTQLMDSLDEEMITQMLNEYLNSMAEIAIKHGGTVDKFMGDGMMIFFGDPQSNGPRADAIACCRMALEMRYKLRSLRKIWAEAGITSPLHIRIGIHTGYCAVGNFGSENRMDYTAVGGVVNIASRLEGKASRDGILISSATYQFVSENIHCLSGEALMLKGIRQLVDTYSVSGEKHEPVARRVDEKIQGLRVVMNPDEIDVIAARELLTESLEAVKQLERERNKAKGVVRLLR